MLEQGQTPDIVIVYGSETRLLASLFDRPWQFVRIYNRNQPSPRENCRDIASIDDLDETLDALGQKIENHKLRIAFIGAAFRTQNQLFIAEPLSDIHASLEVNVVNYARLAHILLPRMVTARFGRIVYLSSFRAITSSKGVSIYAASKAFGEKFFEVIGKEYGRLNVTTATIRMGYFDGRMTDFLSEDKISDLTKSIGSNRLGESSDLISTIDFALSNPYLNGGVIDLSGGISFD